jgi:hypothetical protein
MGRLDDIEAKIREQQARSLPIELSHADANFLLTLVRDQADSLWTTQQALADRHEDVRRLQARVELLEGQRHGETAYERALQLASERQQRITQLEQALAERDRQLQTQAAEASERLRELLARSQAPGDAQAPPADGAYERALQLATSRHLLVVALQRALAERDRRIEQLSERMRDALVHPQPSDVLQGASTADGPYEQALALATSRQQQITRLEQALAERDRRIEQLSEVMRGALARGEDQAVP